MSVHYNGQNIKEMYYNQHKIAEAYYNGEKVFGSIPSGTTIFESSTPGTYTVNIPSSGKYTIYLVGGGGGSSYRAYSPNIAVQCSGGSGAGFVGVATIPSGSYQITVGDSSSNTEAFGITAGSGGTGTTSEGAAGVLVNNSTVTIESTVLSTNGNSGQKKQKSGGLPDRAIGGASVYLGYGTGESRLGNSATGRTDGYVKIVSGDNI